MNINRFKKLHALAVVVLLCLFFNDAISVPTRASNLSYMYDYYCNTPSDINEHIPVLRSLANECSSVTEIGVRSIVSTWGIFQGLSENSFQQKTYLGIDLANPPLEQLQLAKKLAEENGIHFTFWCVNDMQIELEPTDMLFIDSLHTYCHLTYELEAFSPKVRTYICLHDTSDPWGNRDDNEYYGNYSEYPASYDKTQRGLWPAVEDFLQRHPEWKLVERRTNNHGFTILKRNDSESVKEPVYHAKVDDFLENKIILCTGPSLGRYDMLKNTIEADLQFIPFKKIFVTTNDQAIMNITFKEKKPDFCELIASRGLHMDCLNCIITTIKNAANDPTVLDDDIILFKQESVFINDMDLIKKGISKILSGDYNMVTRIVDLTGGMTAADAFFVKVSAIREIINELSPVTQFPPDTRYCDSYFTKYIVNKIKKMYGIHYHHSNAGFTELGFYRIPTANEIFYPMWDRKNKDQLFNDL